MQNNPQSKNNHPDQSVQQRELPSKELHIPVYSFNFVSFVVCLPNSFILGNSSQIVNSLKRVTNAFFQGRLFDRQGQQLVFERPERLLAIDCHNSTQLGIIAVVCDISL